MSASEKESSNQVFCLFHERVGCSCDVPVTNKATLIYRLIQEIKTNNFLNLNSTSKEAKAKRQKETEALQVRLDKLTRVF
jgi:hypothetical protein